MDSDDYNDFTAKSNSLEERWKQLEISDRMTSADACYEEKV